MQTQTLLQKAAAFLNTLGRSFKQAPAAPHDGHDPHWRAQQAERGERERALFQLRALGWPSA